MIANIAKFSDQQLIDHYSEVVQGYCDGVLSGEILTGRWERLAVERYLRDIKDPRFRHDTLKAAKACAFFPRLKLSQGKYKGKRFHLAPIQAFIAWNIYGFVNLDDDFRRFRDVYVTLGRGNGKTPLGSAIAIKNTAFDTPRFERAECYLTATKRDQAAIAFGDFCAFVEGSGLSSRISCLKHLAKVRDTGSTIKPIPADSKTSDGFRVYFLLRDEFHAWEEHHRNFNNVLVTGLGKFDQTMELTITTAGDENSRLWIEKDRLATLTLDPDADFEVDELFAMICRLDEDDDVLDIENYPKANPLMRHGIVKREKIAKLIEEAQVLPSSKRTLTRYYANRLVESGSQSITKEMWDRSVCRGDRKMPALTSIPHGGLDMGQTDDLAAVAYCWQLGDVPVQERDKDGIPKVDENGNPVIVEKPTFAFKCDTYCSASNIRLREEPFRTWAAEGFIRVTDSEWTDPKEVRKSVEATVDEHGIATLACDPNNTRTFALDVLQDLGVEPFMFQQSHAKYNEPMKELKRAMLEGRVFVEDDPLLRWCFLNVIEKNNAAGHIMPDKQKSRNKIDPFVACLMAFSESTFGEKPFRSVYENRGAITA